MAGSCDLSDPEAELGPRPVGRRARPWLEDRSHPTADDRYLEWASDGIAQITEVTDQKTPLLLLCAQRLTGQMSGSHPVAAWIRAGHTACAQRILLNGSTDTDPIARARANRRGGQAWNA